MSQIPEKLPVAAPPASAVTQEPLHSGLPALPPAPLQADIPAATLPAASKSRGHGRDILLLQPRLDYEDTSSEESYAQTHARVRRPHTRRRELWRPTTRHSIHSISQGSSPGSSNVELSASITRFQSELDTIRCKLRIFGESLSLCRCIAGDFQQRLASMEQRLASLEKRHRLNRTDSSNYSAIIQKNRRLADKTKLEVKKLQMCGTEEEMREVAARICRNYLHGAWQSTPASQLQFQRISGGLSNFLYYVALPDDPPACSPAHEDDDDGRKFNRTSSFSEEPRKVLLRIYGQVHGERAMDAIVTESVIFTLLSERRLGPRLHGVFSGGRIEEYIPARPLLTAELAEPALSMKIAEKMAAIHCMEVPLSKEPCWMWKTMAKWHHTASTERLAPHVVGKTPEENKIIKRLKTVDFNAEISWLKKFLATVDSPVVFCHNDMQEGNILIWEDSCTATDDEPTYHACTEPPTSHKDNNHTVDGFDENTLDSVSSRLSDFGEPRLVLIDFEYCAYNHRGFDIANHFAEWGYDYTNPAHPYYYERQESWPTLEQKEIFIREYLKHYLGNLSEDKDVTPSIDDVNHLLSEVEAFALASHLFWTLWSIVNASKSQIPFGYWEYALSRLETYLRLKQELIKTSQAKAPSKRKICEVDI